jgi:hypothetical protein
VHSQIVGPQQDGNEIKIEESQFIGNEVVDAGYADQNQQNKNLLKILDEIIFESFHSAILFRHPHPGTQVQESRSSMGKQ